MEKRAADTSTEKYVEDRIDDGIRDNLRKGAPLTPMEKQIALQVALKIDPGVERWAWAALQVSNICY